LDRLRARRITGDYGPIHTSTTGFVTITPSDVQVRGAATPSAMRNVTGRQTITLGGDIYAGAVEFSVPSGGEYEVTVRGEGSGRAMLARSITDSLGSVALWAIAGAIAGLVAILGLVFVLVGDQRLTAAGARLPLAAPMPMAYGPPPGWYADPTGTGGHRWWDGQQWTAHASAPPPPPPTDQSRP
jgi:hypothetical protein